MSSRPSTRGRFSDHYTVGWICALQEEFDCAYRMLDEELGEPEALEESDDSTYTFGRIGSHYVVIGCLPAGRYGTNSAVCVARDMKRSFPQLRFALMVGIGGGLPTPNRDIRLGDVVVSMPCGTYGGVVQYDLGKRLPGGDFQLTGHLNGPPDRLLGVITRLRSHYNDPRKPDRIAEHLCRMDDRPEYRRPSHDYLFCASYNHQGAQNCDLCDLDQLVLRADRRDRVVALHYGTIASGNSVIKDAATRDQLANSEIKPLCLEMEAAGLMNNLPCMVIRGICDYADSHKNDDWHNYAALTAAAYARELLLVLKPSKVTVLPSWVDKVKTSITRVSEDVREVQSCIDENRIHRWLSPADPSTNLNTAMSSLESGTGVWLLEDKSYKKWKRQPEPPIWLYGIPGSGKTILSSLVIDDCATISSPATSSLLYFYFHFADSEKRTHDAMVRSIVWQLASQGSEARKALSSLFQSCNDGQKQPSREQLYDVFDKMVDKKKDIYIVIDALDECTERERLMWFIRKFNSAYKEKLHLFVSSRQEKDIEQCLQSIVGHRGIQLDNNLVNMDINLYIRRRLQIDEGLDRWKNMRTEIESKIMDKADGMFRWAVCQLNSVRQCLDRPMLRRTLATLPRTLEETYFRIISSIEDCHKEHAWRILQWLVYAVQPLRVEEIIDVLAVRLEEGQSFDPEDRLQDVKDILSICSSLITIEKSKHVTLVRLSHISVKDYLLSDHAQVFLKDSMQKQTANAAIASVCLSYILQLNTNCWADPDRPLTIYAVKHWPTHARTARERPESLMQLVEELFLWRKKAFLNWIHLYEGEDPPWRSPRRQVPGWDEDSRLFYASSIGLARLVRLILDRGGNPNTYFTNHGDTPLQVAAQQGHVGVIQELLDKDADPNLCNNQSGTALQISSHEGHEEIVRRLLARRADPNLTRGNYDSPLQVALTLCHEQIAILLIDSGADPNSSYGEYGSSLQMALGLDFAQVTQHLLDNGADPNATTGRLGTALQIASQKGNEQLVRRLLANGANPNLCHAGISSPLRTALDLSHARIVELLLDAGAEPHPQVCGTALELAAYDGGLEMIRVLINFGPSVESCRAHYEVALWMASSQGHKQIVQLLIGKFANVSNEFLDLAIEWARKKKHHGIVQLLLEKWRD